MRRRSPAGAPLLTRAPRLRTHARAGSCSHRSSPTAQLPPPRSLHPCADAAVGLDESIRLELRKLGKDGVKTTVVCPFFIDTGMFNGATYKFPRFTPLLKPDYAAKKIVDAVLLNKPTLLLPLAANLIGLIKGVLPAEIAADLADWFGVLDSMDDFKGRAPAKLAADGGAAEGPSQAFPVSEGATAAAAERKKKTK